MTVTTFSAPQGAAFAFTLKAEGGWKPPDPGDPNPTLQGVTQARYSLYRREQDLPERSVREMDQAECHAIYLEEWDTCHAGTIAEASGALAVVHFDTAFNAGPHEAALLLQRTVGAPEDGVIGPATLHALAQSIANSEEATIVAYLQNRLSFYERLPNWGAWGAVWRVRLRVLARVVGVPPVT